MTKDVIAVGRASDESETLLDAIPFVDIESIRDMLADDNANLEKKNGTVLNSLIITTVPGGHNSGRTYYIQASSPELHEKVSKLLTSYRKEARKRAEFNTRFAKSQYRIRKIFKSRIFQNLSALLIILVREVCFFQMNIQFIFDYSLFLNQNFLSSIIEAQYGRKLLLQDGSSTQLGSMMDKLNLFFTAYFTLELMINAYANWLQVFIANGWNHLDVFIVLMSLLDLGALSIPDWFVKLVRAFRVIRLFGRIDALKKMAAAVTASIFPMMNAFVILLIVLSICACDDTLPLLAHNALALGTHHSASQPSHVCRNRKII